MKVCKFQNNGKKKNGIKTKEQKTQSIPQKIRQGGKSIEKVKPIEISYYNSPN